MSRRAHMAVGRRVRAAHQRGVTLAELLISMLLGLILLSATLTMVLSTSRTNDALDGLSRIQEAGRFALFILEHDIRMAGYQGCASGLINNLINPSGTGYSDAVYDFNRPFFGWSEAAVGSIPTGTLPASFGQNYARGDLLIVKNAAEPMGVQLAATAPATAVALQLTAAIDVPVGRLILVTDCNGGGDLFQITTDDPMPSARLERNATAVGISPGNKDPSTNNLSRLYQALASEVSIASSQLYYVGFSHNSDGSLSTNTGLRRIRFGERDDDGLPPDEELLSGVHDLRVRYGVDQIGSGSADSYLTAAAMTAENWEQVVAVRISVLAYTGADLARHQEEARMPVPFDEAMWDFTGSEAVTDPDGVAGELLFVPPDRQIYRFFTTTVAARNRVG